MQLRKRWTTQPGVKPAAFIYLAAVGNYRRVHATRNNGEHGEVLLREEFRDEAAALAAIDRLMAEHGGPDNWVEL
jgi:hypothetical protein